MEKVGNFVEGVSAAFTISLAVVLTFFPLQMASYLSRNSSKLHTKKFQQRVGTMYQGLELDNGNWPLMYHAIFVARRLVFAFLILFSK